MVRFESAALGRTYYIDPYEATVYQGYALSISGRTPQSEINYADAKAACKKSGKRLCSVEELEAACLGPSLVAFSFQTTKTGLEDKCDVNEAVEEEDEEEEVLVRSSKARVGLRYPNLIRLLADDDTTTESQTEADPTGSHADCKTTGLDVYDLIGGVSEWATTETEIDGKTKLPYLTSWATTGAALGASEVVSYCNVYAIDGSGGAFDETTVDPSIGFRCCSDTDVADPLAPRFPYVGD